MLSREMTRCEQSEGLAIDCILALDAVSAANQRMYQAVTQMQIEGASTNLLRVEAHALGMFRDLSEHCRRHGCATAEIAKLLGQDRPAELEVAQV